MSAEELRELGLSREAVRWRVEQGRLFRQARGAYSLAPSVTGAGRFRVALIACGESSWLAARSAAVNFGWLRPFGRIEVVTTGHVRGPEWVRVRRARSLAPQDVAAFDGLRTTSPARTLLDLAETAPPWVLERALHESEYQGHFDLHAVDDVLARANGRRGAPLLRAALKAYRPRGRTRSETEERFLRLARQAGVGEDPRVNTHVDVGDRLVEVDVLFPRLGLVVEVDGTVAHDTTKAKRRDPRKDASLILIGLVTLHVSGDDVWDDGAYVVRTLRDVATRRRAELARTPPSPAAVDAAHLRDEHGERAAAA